MRITLQSGVVAANMKGRIMVCSTLFIRRSAATPPFARTSLQLTTRPHASKFTLFIISEYLCTELVAARPNTSNNLFSMVFRNFVGRSFDLFRSHFQDWSDSLETISDRVLQMFSPLPEPFEAHKACNKSCCEPLPHDCIVRHGLQLGERSSFRKCVVLTNSF